MYPKEIPCLNKVTLPYLICEALSRLNRSLDSGLALARERQTFLLAHRHWGDERGETTAVRRLV